MKKQEYYLGLDIGTDSVGYAVTDEKYNLLKFKGESVWGATVFDAGMQSSERRGFRTARRRLDRRQQRIVFLQELFAKEIERIDSCFFKRIRESNLYREDVNDKYILFVDETYNDQDYYAQYPTIHHLITELMNSKEEHDVRLVYLACSWLVAHRGHFLSNMNMNNVEEIKEFQGIYNDFMEFFVTNSFMEPWSEIDVNQFGTILREKVGVTSKTRQLTTFLYHGQKPSKEATEEFPFSREAIVKLLAGATCKIKDIFVNEEYADLGSISLGMAEEKFEELMAAIGEDYALIEVLRKLYDWTLLVDTLGESYTISDAKVQVYETHKKDLANLKFIVKKYLPLKYSEVFRSQDKDNYVAYSYHTSDGDTSKLKRKGKEDFSKYLLSVLKEISPDEKDQELFDSIISKLENRTFLPKQKDTDNRVIPHQLYQYELERILSNASNYLPFLNEKDNDGITTQEKIISIFLYRIPYYVGPLNEKSQNAWLVRKAGKIYPWNFEQIVDLDASEECFIRRMTNYCTYIPGEPVLPKESILYHKFTVLNEINNIRINGEKIDVELKQFIYNDLFMNVKKVTKKKLIEFLICNGRLIKGEENALTGIDEEIHSNLVPQIAFKNMLISGKITEEDAEKIIERAAFAEDKVRLSRWIAKNYPQIDENDRKYICNLKLKEFGRLSKYFLTEVAGVMKETGELMSIIEALWSTQNNLMELLSDKFTFHDEILQLQKEYYTENAFSLADRLEEMRLSNAVKRPVYRTLDIVNDIYKAFGTPKKIMVEMARGATEDQKGKRTKTRYQQLLELYSQCKDEDVRILRRQLEEMGERADNLLQGDKLFLYFLQCGKSAYSGKPIDLSRLATREYDIDHIYPQAYVKDDSILNNKVLVLSEENGAKKDVYPISDSIRHSMRAFWEYLKSVGLMTDEKFKRLVRSTPFTDEEKYGFINRQIVETSQSTKAVATLLKEKFPNAEIVYSKARLTTEFRQEFHIWKSRLYNDLHHAVDAYLNIVTGNVYNMKFTKNFNIHMPYSIKTKTVFTHPVICSGITVWDGDEMLARVRKTAIKNNAHFTKYAFMKKGGLFDQMPVSAAEGLTPLKKGLPTEKYGGYNKAGAMFFIPTKYRAGKKEDILILSVELLHGKHFLEDIEFAREYAIERTSKILGKQVDDVSFPMGMRPWKINTVLSLDGFKVCITGFGSKGRSIIVQPMIQFSSDPYWAYYLKKLEVFQEKHSKNSRLVYDAKYDEIDQENNIKLYDLYISKLENTVYAKRPNSPLGTLQKGRKNFISLDISQQVFTLLSIQEVFGRMTVGCDLSLIGGASRAASTANFTATISAWKKSYSNVVVIDSSTTGLYEKCSTNLLDLL